MNIELPKRVLLTNTTSDVGAGIAKELAEAGCEVIGADFERLPLGLRSRHLKRLHRLPDAMDPGFDAALLELVRTEKPDVVLPIGTRATAAACAQAEKLASITGLNVPTREAFEAAFDHAMCRAECEKLGIPCPRAYSLEEGLDLLGKKTGNMNLVVKPRTDVGATRGLSYVTDADSLRRRFGECAQEFGGAVLQEFIPGEPSRMHTALLLFDRDSRLTAAFTTRKLRQWPPSGGVTAASVSTADQRLVDLALPFFAQWRWRGPAEVEFKLDPRDGCYKVIEINGRFPGYARFAALCGLPLGRLTVALALGRTASSAFRFPEYAVGRRYVNPALFARTVFADLRSSLPRRKALKQAAADCAGTGPQIRSMLSDPLPMIGRLLQDVVGCPHRRPR